MREARRSTAAKLLKQLVTKRQMAAVRDQSGRLCTGVKEIGKPLSTHWKSVMQSPNKGVAECQMYIRGCEPPDRWSTTLPSLWQEPNENTVTTALERLDPQSSPGLGGIPSLLYQTFPEKFCLRMLQQVTEMRQRGTFQDS